MNNACPDIYDESQEESVDGKRICDYVVRTMTSLTRIFIKIITSDPSSTSINRGYSKRISLADVNLNVLSLSRNSNVFSMYS